MKKEIARFQKNSTADVVFRITEFNDQDLLDIRVYLKTVPTEKEIATKKGLCIRLEQFPEFFDAVKKADNAIQNLKQKEKK